MPIIGLTDRGAMFPQIGVLRKGAPKPETGNKPGADLQYFRFDADDQDAAAAFEAVYGKEPKSIRVFLPFASTSENFEAWREEWSASSLKHRCDGENCVRWLTPQGTYSTEPKKCPGGCKQVGRLKAIVPELRRMAYVTVLTTSIHDILEINANLLALEAARGDLRGIPLLVKRVPREISTPGADGKRVRREKWLIFVEAQPQWVELQLQAAAQAAMPGATVSTLALPEWSGEDEDDEGDDGRLTYDDLAEIYQRITNRPAKTQPMERVVDWTKTRPDLFEWRGEYVYRAKNETMPPDPEAERRVEIDLKNHCLSASGGDRAKAAKLWAERYAKLDFHQRQEALLSLANGTPVDQARENLIQEIEHAFKELHQLGKTHDEITEQVARLCNGRIDIDDMDKSTLVKLAEGIFFWRDAARTELKKGAGK